MSLATEFETWWRAFPRKVGRLAAEKEYMKARKHASAEQLLEGIARYVQAKPVYADFCHPKTFLSQGRWLDEPAGAAAPREPWRCLHVTPCGNRAACQNATLLGRPVKAQAGA